MPILDQNHPECREDEFYLGNFSDHDARRIGWKTKRRGEVAYDARGELINQATWRDKLSPWFANKAEVEPVVKARVAELKAKGIDLEDMV